MKDSINDIFYKCVDILRDLAAYLGTTYEAVNVWIFVIIEPIIFLIMLAILISHWKSNWRYRKLLRKNSAGSHQS